MPRIKSFPEQVAEKDRSHLVDALATELQDESPAGHQPLVVEQEIRQTRSVHVYVFWDRWAAVPREQRSSIIMDAYDKADPTFTPKILIAMGLTFEEAIELNLLPYQIETTLKDADPVVRNNILQAMLDEGAVQTSYGIQLRFPTQAMAQEAYSRLTAKFPGPYFQIAQTVARTDN